ncbi:hypothetical protein EV121DRAFT_274125 [Schizophyllum commune]
MTTSSSMAALEAKYGYYTPIYETNAVGVLQDQRGNVVLSAAHPAVQDYLHEARITLKLPHNYDSRVVALAALETFYHPLDPAHWLLWGRREAPTIGKLLDKLVLKDNSKAIYHGSSWIGSDSMLFTLSTLHHPDWISKVKREAPWYDQIVAPGEEWWAKEKKIRSGASRPTTRSATRPTRRVTRAKAAEDAAAAAAAAPATAEPPRKRTRAAAGTKANAVAGPSTTTTPAAKPRTRQRVREAPVASGSGHSASTPELSRTVSSESTSTLATPPSAPTMSSPRIISRPTQPSADSRDISPGSVTTAVEVIPMDPKGKGKATSTDSAAEPKQTKGRATPRVIATPTNTRPSRAKTQTAKAATLGKRKAADADTELAAPPPRRKAAKRT